MECAGGGGFVLREVTGIGGGVEEGAHRRARGAWRREMHGKCLHRSGQGGSGQGRAQALAQPPSRLSDSRTHLPLKIYHQLPDSP